MAKRKAAKKPTGETKTNPKVEPMVIALAEQLGSFLGRVQKKADGWLENEALRQQVLQIRDGAADLLKQVGKAGDDARKSVTGAAKKSKAPGSPKRRARDGEKSASKGRSGGMVDAAGKRHRRPPPQELFDPRLGEPMGRQMGQKSLKRRGRG